MYQGPPQGYQRRTPQAQDHNDPGYRERIIHALNQEYEFRRLEDPNFAEQDIRLLEQQIHQESENLQDYKNKIKQILSKITARSQPMHAMHQQQASATQGSTIRSQLQAPSMSQTRILPQNQSHYQQGTQLMNQPVQQQYFVSHQQQAQPRIMVQQQSQMHGGQQMSIPDIQQFSRMLSPDQVNHLRQLPQSQQQQTIRVWYEDYRNSFMQQQQRGQPQPQQMMMQSQPQQQPIYPQQRVSQQQYQPRQQMSQTMGQQQTPTIYDQQQSYSQSMMRLQQPMSTLQQQQMQQPPQGLYVSSQSIVNPNQQQMRGQTAMIDPNQARTSHPRMMQSGGPQASSKPIATILRENSSSSPGAMLQSHRAQTSQSSTIHQRAPVAHQLPGLQQQAPMCGYSTSQQQTQPAMSYQQQPNAQQRQQQEEEYQQQQIQEEQRRIEEEKKQERIIEEHLIKWKTYENMLQIMKEHYRYQNSAQNVQRIDAILKIIRGENKCEATKVPVIQKSLEMIHTQYRNCLHVADKFVNFLNLAKKDEGMNEKLVSSLNGAFDEGWLSIPPEMELLNTIPEKWKYKEIQQESSSEQVAETKPTDERVIPKSVLCIDDVSIDLPLRLQAEMFKVADQVRFTPSVEPEHNCDDMVFNAVLLKGDAPPIEVKIPFDYPMKPLTLDAFDFPAYTHLDITNYYLNNEAKLQKVVSDIKQYFETHKTITFDAFADLWLRSWCNDKMDVQ